MPEFVLDVDQETWEKAGSKFITFSADDPIGKVYYKPIELDMPDWDTAGVSIKFPVRIIGNDIDAGKEDKLSAGVEEKAIWKLKDILKQLGVTLEMRKGTDKRVHPVFDSDAVAGKKAVGAWEVQVGNKGGDASKGQIKYPKLVNILRQGFKPEVKELT